MPNWCENKVTVSGEPDEILRFMEYVKGKDIHERNGDIVKNNFCFEKIMPFPNGKYDYDWCIENWGTKWSPSNVYLDPTEGDEYLIYKFNTAWGPPTGIYEHLDKEFPTLHISWFYNEEGVEFAGYLNKE